MASTSTTEIELEETISGAQDSRNEQLGDHAAQPTHIPETSIPTPSRAQDETSAQETYPAGPKFYLLLLNIASVLILSSIDMNIVATAVPTIANHFQTVADVGWYASAFRLSQCAFQFIFGKAYKLFSVKKVFLVANAISIAGSLICGAAATSKMLVVGRAVTGVGSAGMLSGCVVILVQATPLHRRPMFTGLAGAVEGVATLAAPLLGGALTQSLGWRWCFYINPPVGLLTLLLTIFCFTDLPKPREIMQMTTRQKVSQLDILSNLFFIPGLAALFIGLSWAGTKYPWSSGEVIGPLITFAILATAFACNQVRRGDNAALPPRIVRRRSVIAGFIFILFGNSTGNVLEYYLPTYYQVVRGYAPAKSGYLMLPIIIAGTIGALIHGFGTSAIGYYAPFMLFASVIMPVAAGLITTFNVTTSFAQLILYTGLSGLAYGTGFSGPQNAVQTTLPADDVPLGTSVMLFAQAFGPAVAIAVAQLIFTNELSSKLKDLVPGVSGEAIESKGLSQLVSSVPEAHSQKVLTAINKSIVLTWYLVVVLGCATMIGSLLVEWRSVKARRD